MIDFENMTRAEADRRANPEKHHRIRREYTRLTCLELAASVGGSSSDILDRADSFSRFIESAPDGAHERRWKCLRLALASRQPGSIDAVILDTAVAYDGFVISDEAEASASQRTEAHTSPAGDPNLAESAARLEAMAGIAPPAMDNSSCALSPAPDRCSCAALKRYSRAQRELMKQPERMPACPSPERSQ